MSFFSSSSRIRLLAVLCLCLGCSGCSRVSERNLRPVALAGCRAYQHYQHSSGSSGAQATPEGTTGLQSQSAGAYQPSFGSQDPKARRIWALELEIKDLESKAYYAQQNAEFYQQSGNMEMARVFFGHYCQYTEALAERQQELRALAY